MLLIDCKDYCKMYCCKVVLSLVCTNVLAVLVNCVGCYASCVNLLPCVYFLYIKRTLQVSKIYYYQDNFIIWELSEPSARLFGETITLLIYNMKHYCAKPSAQFKFPKAH